MGHGINVTSVCKYLVCNFDLCAAGVPLPSAFVLLVIDYVGFSVFFAFFLIVFPFKLRVNYQSYCSVFANSLQLFEDAVSPLQKSIF